MIGKFWILFLVCISAYGCGNSSIKTNVTQSSFNINHAKELEVFVEEYEPSTKEIDLRNIVFEIEEIWVEHYWTYKNQKREINIEEELNGLIKLNIQDSLSEISISYPQRSLCITGNKLCFNPLNMQDTTSVIFHSTKGNAEVIFTKKKT